MVNEMYGLVEEKHIPLFESLLKQYGQGTVLDLGCGPFDPSWNKSRLVRTLISLDESAYAANFFSSLKLPSNSFFIRGDVRQLPFRDLSIDLALMTGIYGQCFSYNSFYPKNPDKVKEEFKEYLRESQGRLLKETSRVLKSGAGLIVSNSIDRQPLDDTLTHFQKYFKIINVYKGDERYLLECQRDC